MAAIVAVLAVIVILVANALNDAKAEGTVELFLAAYEAQDYETAAELTDGDPEAVAEAIRLGLI